MRYVRGSDVGDVYKWELQACEGDFFLEICAIANNLCKNNKQVVVLRV